MATATEPAEATAVTVASESAPGGFVGRFGLDPWLLLAQVINFLLVLAILTRFVFWPLLKVLRERTTKIEQGLRDADAAATLKTTAETERRRVLAEAAAHAARTLRAKEEEANRLREQILRTAEEEAEAMHDRAARDAEQRRAAALQAATGDVGELVVDTLERVLAETLTDGERARYRAAALRAVRKGSTGTSPTEAA